MPAVISGDAPAASAIFTGRVFWPVSSSYPRPVGCASLRAALRLYTKLDLYVRVLVFEFLKEICDQVERPKLWEQTDLCMRSRARINWPHCVCSEITSVNSGVPRKEPAEVTGWPVGTHFSFGYPSCLLHMVLVPTLSLLLVFGPNSLSLMGNISKQTC